MRSLLAAMLLLVVSPAASAPLQLDPAGCESYAGFVQSAAEVRDLGADIEKHQDLVERKSVAMPADVKRFLRREVARIHASRARPDDLYRATLAYCHGVRGSVDTGQNS